MTRSPHALRACSFLATAVAAVAALPTIASASNSGAGAGMPWNSVLQNLLDALTGTTAHILVALALVLGGFTWAFSRSEEGMRKIGQAVVGGAIAIGAASIVSSLGFAGATL